MGISKEFRHVARWLGRGSDRAPTAHEQPLFDEFRSMSVHDVRRRALDFEGSESSLDEWAGQHAYPDRDRPQPGFVPEHIHGDPAKAWRDLAAKMRLDGALEISDLTPKDQLRWARRTHALSRTFSQPRSVQAGPTAREDDVRPTP